MNDLLCHGGTFFNHFSNNAIVVDVKIENLVTSRKIIAVGDTFEESNSWIWILMMKNISNRFRTTQ